MHFSGPNYQNLTWVIVFINLFSLSTSDPRISEAGLFCGTSGGPPANTVSFVQEMEALSQLLTTNNWGTHNITNSTPPMYGLVQCYQDLSNTDCLLCYAASRTRIPRCLPSSSASLYLDGCFLRYDNYSFYSESIDPHKDTVNCTSSLGDWEMDEKNGGSMSEFNESVGVLVDNVTRIAVGNGGFGVLEVRGVFGLAQCWKTLSIDGCRQCLEKAGQEVKGCLPSREGRGLNAGCYLRYSTQKFFNDGRNNESSGKSDCFYVL